MGAPGPDGVKQEGVKQEDFGSDSNETVAEAKETVELADMETQTDPLVTGLDVELAPATRTRCFMMKNKPDWKMTFRVRVEFRVQSQT